MKVYIPTPITSAEQAEALPVGTVAVEQPDRTRMAYIRGDHGAPWYATTDGDAWTEHDEMVGAFALVPIEAEEEWALIYDGEEPTPCSDEADAREWSRIDGEGQAPSHRYTTIWEEA